MDLDDNIDVAALADEIRDRVYRTARHRQLELANPDVPARDKALSEVERLYNAARQLDHDDLALPIALDRLAIACLAAVEIL